MQQKCWHKLFKLKASAADEPMTIRQLHKNFPVTSQVSILKLCQPHIEFSSRPLMIKIEILGTRQHGTLVQDLKPIFLISRDSITINLTPD